MKQNCGIVSVTTKGGQMLSRHVQVVIGLWHENRITRKVRTKAWDRWHLMYVTEGKGLLTWPGGQFVLPPQMALLLSPHTEYTYQADPVQKEWTQYSAEFLPRAHWYEWLRWPEIAPGIMAFRVGDGGPDQRIREALDEAINDANTPRPMWEDFALSSLEHVLLLFQEINPRAQQAQVADPRLQTAIEFMERNQSKQIQREEIAKAAAVSPSYLGVLFRRHLRTTPQQYLDMLRINRAQRLLRETSEQISQVAYLTGYDSPTYFCRRFKAITGQTPGEYRKVMK